MFLKGGGRRNDRHAFGSLDESSAILERQGVFNLDSDSGAFHENQGNRSATVLAMSFGLTGVAFAASAENEPTVPGVNSSAGEAGPQTPSPVMQQGGGKMAGAVPGAAPDAEALKEWLNARVGKTQRVAEVRFIARLPRSGIGKVLKRELRQAYDGSLRPGVASHADGRP